MLQKISHRQDSGNHNGLPGGNFPDLGAQSRKSICWSLPGDRWTLIESHTLPISQVVLSCLSFMAFVLCDLFRDVPKFIKSLGVGGGWGPKSKSGTNPKELMKNQTQGRCLSVLGLFFPFKMFVLLSKNHLGTSPKCFHHSIDYC